MCETIIQCHIFRCRVWFSTYLWRNRINERKGLTAPVTITISSSCSSANGNVSVTLKNTSSTVISGNLHVLLKERGVKYTDTWKAGFVDNVMRDMFPGPKGQSMTIQPGESVTKTHSFTKNSAWKKDSCRIVAFLQKSDNEIVEGCVSGVNTQVSILTETSTVSANKLVIKLQPRSLAVSIPEKGDGVLSNFNIQGKQLAKIDVYNSNEWIEIPAITCHGNLLVNIQMKKMSFTECIKMRYQNLNRTIPLRDLLLRTCYEIS